MNYTEITTKLIGNITPIGMTEVDRDRLENLKEMCLLVSNLVEKIDTVYRNNKHSYEHSVKEMADYAENFLYNELNIKRDE